MSRILITGAAGFIGAACCARLLDEGIEIVGVDNLSPYYDVTLKRARLARLQGRDGFRFQVLDLADGDATRQLFEAQTPARVLHLAAQPGVRHSCDHPQDYVAANLVGFANVLEGCRHHRVEHLVYASSSSVYGANGEVPLNEHHGANHPLSLYAATKRANELMAHSYSHLYQLPTTGLRLFTVYGPWGRPDMSPMLFADRIVRGEPLDVFNYGRHSRDFTYVDDVVEGIRRCLDAIPQPVPDAERATSPADSPVAPFRVFNIGSHRPVELMRFIELLEEAFGRTVDKRLLPLRAGDMEATCADVTQLIDAVGYSPDTSVEQGVARFASWYRDYFGV